MTERVLITVFNAYMVHVMGRRHQMAEGHFVTERKLVWQFISDKTILKR